jgi:hypothetical protein
MFLVNWAKLGVGTPRLVCSNVNNNKEEKKKEKPQGNRSLSHLTLQQNHRYELFPSKEALIGMLIFPALQSLLILLIQHLLRG